MSAQAQTHKAGDFRNEEAPFYGRALQEPALKAWQVNIGNAAATQQALYQRAFLNDAARTGDYMPVMETETFIPGGTG